MECTQLFSFSLSLVPTQCTVFNLLQRATAAFGIGSDGMDVFDGSVDPLARYLTGVLR